MKKLYIIKVSEYVVDTNEKVYEAEQPGNIHFQLRYGEIPEPESNTYNQKEIKELFDNGTHRQKFFFIFRAESIFKKEWKVYFCYNNAFMCEKSIKLSKVKEIKQVIEYKELNSKDFSFEKLMKELSTDEFFDFLKDNNISICKE